MPKDEINKSAHGTNAQRNLEDILKLCKEHEYIVDYVGPYRKGMPEYSNEEQFYALFCILFGTGEKWILYSTTSLRTDRVKEQQWDASNLKIIESEISNAYLIYPDGISSNDKKAFIKQNNKYLNNEEYSALDGIISQETLFKIIEQHALDGFEPGKIKDLIGRVFENRIAAIMSNRDNLKKWNDNTPESVGLQYPFFEKILQTLDLHGRPFFIKADTKISKLPSGGNPKTDVIVSVAYEDDTSEKFTISCKRTNKNSVSVHQYTADAFASVLDPTNDNLKALLYAFQAAGSLSELGKEKCTELKKALKPYREQLAMWVLGGIGGEGDSETQWARYILTYDDELESISIHSIEDYYKLLLERGFSGTFDTGFSWTYASGRRGQSIQLKCPIL